MGELEGELVPEVHIPDLLIRKDGFRRSLGEGAPLGKDGGPVADREGFPDVVVRDEHPDAPGLEGRDDASNLADGNGVDAGEGFIEEHVTRIHR